MLTGVLAESLLALMDPSTRLSCGGPRNDRFKATLPKRGHRLRAMIERRPIVYNLSLGSMGVTGGEENEVLHQS